MLSKFFPKLVEAFSDKGIDCSQFVDMQKWKLDEVELTIKVAGSNLMYV